MCYSSALTPDGANEIYISLSITDPVKAALTLLHELIHAADDNRSGHKGEFERLALQVGFERPLTHYSPSDQLITRTKELLELLPPSPLVPMASPQKEKGRMVQYTCTNLDCGFFFHTTKRQAAKLEEAEEPACPVCAYGTLYQKRK
jgi:hypothetical protein